MEVRRLGSSLGEGVFYRKKRFVWMLGCALAVNTFSILMLGYLYLWSRIRES